MEPDFDEILRLLAVLKRQYKAANLSYAAVAAAIGVSEPTVKRRMAGKGLSLQGLAELCRAANLRIADLAAMAGEKTQQERPRLTDVQIQKLLNDPALGMIWRIALAGLEPGSASHGNSVWMKQHLVSS